MSLKFFVLISSSLFLGLTACESKKEDNKISYQYTINGCDTGAKSFDNHQAYCDTLINDAANNNCARAERLRVHAEKCGGGGAQTKAEAPNSTEPLSQGSERDDRDSSETTVTTTGVADAIATAQPKLLTVTARSETRLKVSPRSSGDVIVTNLTGSLKVESIEPQFATPLRLIGVKNEIIGLDETCEISVNNFVMTSDNKRVDFTIIGTDEKGAVESSGCLAQLSTMAMKGFSVEFQNVPTGNFVPQKIEKVRLNIRGE